MPTRLAPVAAARTACARQSQGEPFHSTLRLDRANLRGAWFRNDAALPSLAVRRVMSGVGTMARLAWAEWQIVQLQECLMRGIAPEETAGLLGKTKEDVCAKAFELGSWFRLPMRRARRQRRRSLCSSRATSRQAELLCTARHYGWRSVADWPGGRARLAGPGYIRPS